MSIRALATSIFGAGRSAKTTSGSSGSIVAEQKSDTSYQRWRWPTMIASSTTVEVIHILDYLRSCQQMVNNFNSPAGRDGLGAAVVLGTAFVTYQAVSYMMEAFDQNFVDKCLQFSYISWPKFRDFVAPFLQGLNNDGSFWPQQDDIDRDVRRIQAQLNADRTRLIVESAFPMMYLWRRRNWT
jgi:hypothetical protein